MVRFLLNLLLPAFFFLSCSSRSDHTITIWTHFDPPEKKLVQKQINQFAAENPDWDFKLMTFSAQEIKTLYPLAVIGGSGPSILYGSTTETGQLSELNVLEPLETLFDSTFLAGFTTLSLNPVEPQKNQTTGQIHLYQVADQIVNQVFILYNKELISMPEDSANHPARFSTSNFNQIYLSNSNSIDYDLVWDYNNPIVYYHFLSGFGGQLIDQYNQPQLDSPAAVAMLSSLRELTEKGLKLPLESNNEQARLLFRHKKSPMLIDGLFKVKEFENAGLKIGIARIPALGSLSGMPKPFVSGNGYSINPVLSATQKKMASKLIRYLCTKENQLERVRISFNLPLRTDALTDSSVQNNQLFKYLLSQVLDGTPQPSTPESKLTLQVLSSGYQEFLKDRTLSPEKAARDMQTEALNQIRNIRK